jgi:hypothetical protein
VGRSLVHLAPLLAALLLAPAASAGDWLPHPNGAGWTYSWRDSEYNPTPTKEKVTVSEQKGDTFTLAWTTQGLDNPPTAVSGNGTVSFQETGTGLVNTNWTSSPPPIAFPILCAQAASCGNSLASVYYNVIWGTRQPTLAEPLIRGTSWTTTGGSQNDVAGASDYMGTEMVSVPAFPAPVRAAVIRTEVSQAGAIGDPYGTGVRTVWWVYGVGPVKILFRHAGGGAAPPVTTAVLLKTTLAPEPPPPDVSYFPLRAGFKGQFRWTNATHLKQPEVQSFKVDQAANGSGRVSIQSVSGPIKVKGAYYFTLRSDGVSNLAGSSSAATLLKLPPLGPKALPQSKRRRFVNVFDLMDFGFNPIVPAAAATGTTWSSRPGTRDFDVYGVDGTSRVVGVQKVTVPAGTFQALAVRTTLKQPGYPWGSGVRTSWFAPGRGLVKLVFRHDDGSVSTVERLK